MDKLPVSLCMIVKNEERHLASCLKSVQEWVDEMVIVDTGSSDRTIDIAREFQASVYNHTWKNDFAEARNASLAHAKNPWILQLDADEEICRNDIPWFYQTYPWEEAFGYYLDIHNLSTKESGEVSLIHRLIRFYRNHPDVHYESAIHETLHIHRTLVSAGKVRILHKGYNYQADIKGKRRRNLAILQEKLRESPHNPFLLSYLAQHYYMEGEPDKAIAFADQALWYGVTFPMRRHILHLCFKYAFSGKNDTLLKKYFRILPRPEVLPDYYFYHGRRLELQGQLHEAAKCYQLYRRKTGQAGGRKNESHISELEVDLRRREAGILSGERRFAEAASLLQEAVTMAPSTYQLWAELGQAEFNAGSIDQARKHFIRALQILEQVPATPQIQALIARYQQLIERLESIILQ